MNINTQEKGIEVDFEKSKKEEKMSDTSEQEELFKSVPLYYESHHLLDKQQCRECGSTSVYTRVYFHPQTGHSRWLCYNCADDYIQYRGYRLLEATYQPPDSSKPPPFYSSFF